MRESGLNFPLRSRLFPFSHSLCRACLVGLTFTLMKRSKVRFIVIVVILGLIAAFLGYQYGYNKAHVNVMKADAVYEGEATGLYQEFVSEPEQASARYAGNVVQVSGMISELSAGPDNTILQLEAGNPMGGGIGVVLDASQQKEAERLNAGDRITVRALCSGLEQNDDGLLAALGSSVQLRAAVLVTP